MPPKAKFTKQEIINASIEIIETTGIDTLTARSLGRQTRKFCQTYFYCLRQYGRGAFRNLRLR